MFKVYFVKEKKLFGFYYLWKKLREKEKKNVYTRKEVS